ncbi:MAG: hypothetical protein KDD42_04675 [Bdellovibrionales bacterium]|nr:hypothetical protein [Bdellovibrionales bacterium]
MSSVSCFEKLFREGLLWFAAQDGSKAHTGGSPLASTQLPTHQRVVKFCLPQIDQVLPQHGLAFGALHEWCLQDPVSPQQFMPCSLPTILAAHAIEQDPALQNKFSIWIGEAIWPSAFCIQQSFPAEYFERCIFIDPPNQKLLLWSIETALRSHAAAVIVAQCPALSFALTRRFALAVKKSGALGFLSLNILKVAALLQLNGC